MFYKIISFSFVPEQIEFINVAILLESDYIFRLMRDDAAVFPRLGSFIDLNVVSIKLLNEMLDHSQMLMEREGLNEIQAFGKFAQFRLSEEWVKVNENALDAMAALLIKFLKPMKTAESANLRENLG